MNNIINYFYGINIIEVYNNNNKFVFNYNGNIYEFIKLDRNKDDIKGIVEICEKLKQRNIMTDELVKNIFNNYLTPYKGFFYIMIKKNIKTGNISFNDILYIQNNTLNISLDKNLIRNNCVVLWENKIDFYEKKSNELGKKYSLISKSIDYYIGLGENAITYLINNNVRINNLVLSHRRLDDFYNPLNYIIDSRARDIAEYIKKLFFYDDNKEETIMSLLKYINFNREEYILFISRMLYPTYYFDLIDKILCFEEDEEIIKSIINKNDSYIKLIKRILYYINYDLRMNVPIIEWIIKK